MYKTNIIIFSPTFSSLFLSTRIVPLNVSEIVLQLDLCRFQSYDVWHDLVSQKYSETSKWPTASIFIVEQSNLKRKQYFRLKSPWFLPGYSYHPENLDSFHKSFIFYPLYYLPFFLIFIFRRASVSCEKRPLFYLGPSVRLYQPWLQLVEFSGNFISRTFKKKSQFFLNLGKNLALYIKN
jgi:hypothetical protein